MATKAKRIQRFAGLLGFWAGVAAVGLVLLGPAQAQRMFDWFGGFGNYPSGPRERSVEREVDYSRAPAAKKPDTPPTSNVLVIGDSMADWLAYGLEDALSDMPELGVLRRHRSASGLIRYDSRNENLEWAQATRDLIAAEKPQYIVMMIGLSDRTSIRERLAPPRGAAAQPNQRGAAPAAAAPPAAAPAPAPQPNDPQADPERDPASPEQQAAPAPEPAVRGRAAVGTTITHEFRSERWAELYSKKIDDVIAVMKARGVPVYWVGLPSIRGQRSMSEVAYLNELYRARAEKAGITYVDVWDGFVDDSNRFVLQGPDFEGQTRRLRTPDGAYFTKAGARKLAHYVEREIRRAASRGPVAVALPTTEPQPQSPASRPGTGPTQRPLAGPVMPLTANVTANEGLIGSGGSAGEIAHVTATRVLVKGEAVPPPAGRSDDFAWPRRGVAPFGSDPVVATTTLPLPVMQAAPAQTTVPVPTGETPAVVAAVRRPSAPRPSPERQYQQQRNNNFFGFPFFGFR